MRPSANISGAAACICSGKKRSADHDEAVEAGLRLHRAHRAHTGGGNSAYVSGIQVCSGQTGVLIRNANAKPAKIHEPPHVPIASEPGAAPITSVVPLHDAERRRREQQREPAAHVVDQIAPRRAARTRAARRHPQPSISKNTGISIRSQNSAKSSRSLARNTPVIAPCSTSICA
jgi:hypothetical protein